MRVTVSEIKGDHLPLTGCADVSIHMRAADRSCDAHIIGDNPQALRQLAEFLLKCADAFERPYIAEAAE